MATQFDFASLGNIFGGGGTPTGLDALLTEDQRKFLAVMRHFQQLLHYCKQVAEAQRQSVWAKHLDQLCRLVSKVINKPELVHCKICFWVKR